MSNETDQPERVAAEASRIEEAWPHIHQALRGLQYGEVLITVQDGVVIQLERTERKRIRRK